MNLAILKSINSTGVGRIAGRGALIIRRYSPEILTAVGVAGVVTSAVLASKATLHLEEVVDKAQGDITLINEKLDHEHASNYSSTDHKKDLARVYTVAAVDLVKLYGPAVTLGVASIGCLLGAHGIMRKRNVALAAAYKTVEQSFSEYRKRVIAEFGEDKDRDYRFGGGEESTITDETGETITVTHVNPNNVSLYAKFFDETNKNWEKTPEYNRVFIKAQESYANDLLHARGHVFLNDVYDSLGIERTQAGSVVGWVLNNGGDNYIDFGMYDFQRTSARNFVNGYEDSILLDFNVDGVVYDKLKQ